ncbi:MAG: ankyrin repeat domain-containing protein [Vicingaceae bacterium]
MTDQEKVFIEYCIKGDLKSVQRCVENGVEVNVENSWGIHCAAKASNSKLIFYLLENGVSFEDASNAEVLEYAANNNQLAVVEYLIRNSDVYKENNRALQWAAMKGHKVVFEILLTYLENLNGALVSASQNGRIEIVQLLIDNELAENDLSNKTVLYRTAKNGHWRVLDLLIRNNLGDYSTLDKKLLEKYETWKLKNS